jgi:hypothetical protein
MANERVCIAYFEIAERYTILGIMRLAEEKVPNPKCFSFGLELVDNRNDCLPSGHRIIWYLCKCEFGRRKKIVLCSDENTYRL